MLESCAQDLDERFRQWQLEELTLGRAAEESGYSYSTLQQKVNRGEIPNAGRKGRPLIRRCDLPVVQTRRRQNVMEEPDLAARVLQERFNPSDQPSR